MGDLYVSEWEAASLKRIDLKELERRLEEARSLSTTSPLHSLGLGSSGPLVAATVRRLEQAVRANNLARAVRKRARTAAGRQRHGGGRARIMRHLSLEAGCASAAGTTLAPYPDD